MVKTIIAIHLVQYTDGQTYLVLVTKEDQYVFKLEQTDANVGEPGEKYNILGFKDNEQVPVAGKKGQRLALSTNKSVSLPSLFMPENGSVIFFGLLRFWFKAKHEPEYNIPEEGAVTVVLDIDGVMQLHIN